jgi:hypothetical protein
MKTWNGGIAPPFLTSALDGGEWLASRPVVLPRGNRPWYPLDWLGGPQTRSGRCREEKILAPTGNITLVIWFVARCYTDSHPDSCFPKHRKSMDSAIIAARLFYLVFTK